MGPEVERIISNELHLGAFIHDARIEQKLTQGALASKAGVSRTWLIGIEQGTRSRAELGKIFDTLEALGISMKFSLPEAPEHSSENDDQSKKKNPSLIPQSTLEAIRRAAGLTTLPGAPAENIVSNTLSRASKSPLQRNNALIAKALDRATGGSTTSSLNRVLQDPIEKNAKLINKSLDRASGRTSLKALNRITDVSHLISRPLSKIPDPLERARKNNSLSLATGKLLAEAAAKDLYRNAGQTGLAALRNSALTGKPLSEIAHSILRSSDSEHLTTKGNEKLSDPQRPTHKQEQTGEES